MSVKEILEFIKQPWVIITVIVIVLILLLFLIYRSFKKRSLNHKLRECELFYNESVSVPISFKLNKVNNIAKLNQEVEQELNDVKKEYLRLESYFDEMSNLLGSVEDLIIIGKLAKADTLVEDLQDISNEVIDLTRELDTRLDYLLEDEVSQRNEINDLKDKFRDEKTRLLNNVNKYDTSLENLEKVYKSIEDKFSIFEEWMFANDYEKSKLISKEIKSDLSHFSEYLNEIPSLYDFAKGSLPQKIDNLSKTYQESRSAGVYLNHLDVPKSIIFITDKTKDNFNRINNLDLKTARENLEKSYETLEVLEETIIAETKAHNDILDKKELSFNLLERFTDDLTNLETNQEKIVRRFDFDNFIEDINEYRLNVNSLSDEKIIIEDRFMENKTPALKQIKAINEFITELNNQTDSFYSLKELVDQANADENRAKDQLRKLYLIINDVEVRIKKRSLPSISDKYIHDLERSRAYVHQIEDLLNQEVLDVGTLNGTVAEAIDYIYRLHNNVNNLVGVVDMCEDSIVYANKYRAYVPNIESELTKAEVEFNNGEYTQSLTTIVSAIEKFKPNQAYEEKIKNNARSAR